jgi:putative ABC transport system permease protein
MGWLSRLFRRKRLEEILDDEVRHHIELQVEEYLKAGLSPAEAESAARNRFGTVTSVKERCRDANGTASVESFWQDLRFAARSFASEPAFAAVVLATLALGIGANTAVFSVLRAVILEPLPWPEPDRLVLIWENDRIRGTNEEGASYPDYLDLKQRSNHFEHLAAMQRMDVTLTGRGEAERVAAARVTSNFFAVTGLPPATGRVFRSGEDGVVLSHGLWARKFGRSDGVVGSVVKLDGFTGTVLGVMPPEANALEPRGPELWTSLETVRATQFRGQHNIRILGRLKKGSVLEQAQAEITAIMAGLEKEYPNDNLGRGAVVVTMHEYLAGNLRPALRVLSLAVAVLLLIACVNIVNLLLARASGRSREMAVRVSLGAGRRRLARQLLTESLLLATGGAALGIGAAWWGVKGLIALAPPGTPLIERTSIDGLTMTVTAGISLAAWLLFGLLPAIRASAVDPAGALQISGRHTASKGSLRMRNALVMAQIGMAAVLVISSGLLLRSFWRLRQVHLGYEPRGVITLRIKLPESRYPWPKFPYREWPDAINFYDRLRSAAAELPGVAAASMAMSSPADASWTTRVTVAGRPAPPEGEQDEAQLRTADPAYLKATHARLVRGRFFSRSDDERHPMVAVVNEAFVLRHLPNEEALGNSIVVFGTPREIVGVIENLRYGGPSTAPEPAMYFAFRQMPFPNGTLIVRSGGEPAALASSLRRAVSIADPNVAAFDVITLDEALRESTARERFIVTLLTGFAAIALALAAVGIYGVVAYSVARRKQEIALRMALGARGRDVFSHVVGATLLRTAAGVLAGAAVAALAGQVLQPLVFETSTRDESIYLAVGAVLLAVAFAGSAFPAARAVRVSPASTLRQE